MTTIIILLIPFTLRYPSSLEKNYSKLPMKTSGNTMFDYGNVVERAFTSMRLIVEEVMSVSGESLCIRVNSLLIL